MPDSRAIAVTETEHLWIPMPDGVRLAARLWLPTNAEAAPVPAIFECIPYRKADMVRARDERNHPYFAAHGYACLRVDMRGSGDSEGHMPDMYRDDELADARHVIAWIAQQPWCNGSVGMFGTSWGGTASLQANIDAIEPLKAIIAVCATHDRYEDDIHHMGGCLITDTFEWGATLPAILGAPPTPNVGPDWREKWQDRLANLTFPVENWVREEARGTYWRHGSVIHQADRLARPTLAIGGWADRYSQSVMSLVSARPDLVWGVVGPWGHHYPDHGDPGPAMGFQQLALAWWDRWLKPDRPSLDWPRLQIWERSFDPPADAITTRNGRWIAASSPLTATTPLVLALSTGGLGPAGGGLGGGMPIPFDLRVGAAAGDTGYFGRFGGLPLEQSGDDSLSLTFDTAPLSEDIVLFGGAVASLAVQVAGQAGQVILRLNDVAPDGTTARVAMAVRNLALDDNLDEPSEPRDGADLLCDVALHTTAYRFRKGHRIRLSVSASYWPVVWPLVHSGDVTLREGTLSLPVFAEEPNSLDPLPPDPLRLPLKSNHKVIANPVLKRYSAAGDDGAGISGWEQPFTEVLCTQTQTSFGYQTSAEHRIDPRDPQSARSTFTHQARYRRPDGVADIKSTLTASCDGSAFYLDGRLSAEWNGQEMAQKHWSVVIPRRFG